MARKRKRSKIVTDQVECGMIFARLIKESEHWFPGYKSEIRLLHLLYILWASRRDMFTLRQLQEELRLGQWNIKTLWNFMKQMKRHGVIDWDTTGLYKRKNNYYLTPLGFEVAKKINAVLNPQMTEEVL